MLEPAPKDNRYGSEWKFEGYPQGQETFFLHGRLLLDVIKIDLRGRIIIPPGVALGPVALGTVPPDRAWYIDFFSISGSAPYTANLWVLWQIWGSSKYLVGGTFSEKPCPIRIYLPPETPVTIYIGWSNQTGANVYAYAWISIVEFSAEKDIWEFGNGANIPNPAAVPFP